MNLHLTNHHPSRQAPGPEWRKLIHDIYRRVLIFSSSRGALKLQDLSFVYVEDREMADLNWKYLRHRGPTDILTFDYGMGKAEVLISLDTAQRQARVFRQNYKKELARYHVHGILHLAGFDDRTPSQRQRMRRAENSILQELKKSIDNLSLL